MAEIVYPGGYRIFAQGEDADCAYFVMDGWVEIFSETAEGRQSLGMIGPGEIFGEMAVIDGGTRSAGALAVEPCRLLKITVEQFHALLGRTEPFQAEILSKLVARFRESQQVLLEGGATPRHKGSGNGPGYELLARYCEIADALERGEMEAFLQPIVRLEDGSWCGFEALARWRSPEKGLVPPGDFLPIAERTGLIRRIDLAIAEQAADALKQLDGDATPYINVNFSPVHFTEDSLVPAIMGILSAKGLSTASLRVELTETTMLGNEDSALSVMNRLTGEGFKLALDDFGTGYSSLSILHRMPIQVLKLDRSLVYGVRESGRLKSILRHVVALAREMGLDVVSEGIEDLDMVDGLKALGCVYGQGFAFARPMPVEAALEGWRRQSAGFAVKGTRG